MKSKTGLLLCVSLMTGEVVTENDMGEYSALFSLSMGRFAAGVEYDLPHAASVVVRNKFTEIKQASFGFTGSPFFDQDEPSLFKSVKSNECCLSSINNFQCVFYPMHP